MQFLFKLLSFLGPTLLPLQGSMLMFFSLAQSGKWFRNLHAQSTFLLAPIQIVLLIISFSPKCQLCHKAAPVCNEREGHITLLILLGGKKAEITSSSIVTTMKSSTCALDPLPTFLVKACFPTLSPLITNVINSSLSTGLVPPALKLTSVTPILKKPGLDPDTPNNYRPISNLPFLSKILKCLLNLNPTSTPITSMNLSNPASAPNTAQKPRYWKSPTTYFSLLNLSPHHPHPLDLSAAFDTINLFYPPLTPSILPRCNRHCPLLAKFSSLWQTSIHLHQQLQILHRPSHPWSTPGFCPRSPPILLVHSWSDPPPSWPTFPLLHSNSPKHSFTPSLL